MQQLPVLVVNVLSVVMGCVTCNRILSLLLTIF
jgi:hypothetical protein